MMLLTYEFVTKKVTNFICDLFNYINLKSLKKEVIILEESLTIG
jgi:hypothetical protein